MTDQNSGPEQDPFAPPPAGSVPPPPPPPPGYGTPAAAYPPQYAQPVYPGAAAQNGPGTTALVLGIIGLLCCGLLSIVAVVMGGRGKKLAAQGLATNGGVANAGYILGWIGIVLWVVGIAAQIVWFATGHGSFEFSTSTR